MATFVGAAVLVRKSVVMIVFCSALFRGRGIFRQPRPSSFLPDEDQGYAYVNVQLPNGASLERTTAVAAQDGKNSDEYSRACNT